MVEMDSWSSGVHTQNRWSATGELVPWPRLTHKYIVCTTRTVAVAPAYHAYQEGDYPPQILEMAKHIKPRKKYLRYLLLKPASATILDAAW